MEWNNIENALRVQRVKLWPSLLLNLKEEKRLKGKIRIVKVLLGFDLNIADIYLSYSSSFNDSCQFLWV